MQYKDKMRAPQRTKPTQNLDIQSTTNSSFFTIRKCYTALFNKAPPAIGL